MSTLSLATFYTLSPTHTHTHSRKEKKRTIFLLLPVHANTKMPIKIEPSSTPPPRIGKIGPYTVFVTPPATPNPGPKPESPSEPAPVHKPVQSHPVMAPPAQFYKEKPSSFAFFWDAVGKVQNAHASLDEHVAHWFGLNQSRYQWALDDYYENNEKNQTEVKPGKVENV